MVQSGPEHPNADLIRKLYQLAENHEYAAYFGLLSDDIVYHAAGHCSFSGDYRGKDEFGKLARRINEEAQGTHRVVRRHIMATDSYASVIDSWTAQRNGTSITMDNLLVYRIAGGKVVECWEYIGDEQAHDAFWS